MLEIWKTIPGFDKAYMVSHLGNAKSLKASKSRILKQVVNTQGYKVISISANNKTLTRKIHQLVAIAFLGHKPCGYKLICDHINNDMTDNRLRNLQIITARENTCKDMKIGTSKYTGVCWNKRLKKWVAQIDIDGRKNHLGCFTDELEAAAAYQNKLLSLQ